GQQPVFGCQSREDFRVTSWRRMAEEHRSEAGDRNLECFWPFLDETPIDRREFAGYPVDGFASRFGHRVKLTACQLRQDGRFAVSANKIDRNAEALQALETFARHRPWNDVATDDDSVDARLPRLGENSLECGEIAVNVVNRGYLHRSPSLW